MVSVLLMLIGALYPIGSVVQGAIANALGDAIVTADGPDTAVEPAARNSEGG